MSIEGTPPGLLGVTIGVRSQQWESAQKRGENSAQEPGRGHVQQQEASALWIGGPPGSGKTTVARLIARRRGFRWYNTDAHTWEHRDRAIAAGHRAAIRFEELPIEERWSAPPAEKLEMSLHYDRAPMILDDIRALPSTPLTIAEGTSVIPSVMGAGPRAVWLLPSKEVQQRRLEERGLRPGVLELYQLLVHEIETEVEKYGARTLVVDGTRSVEDTVAAVEELFGEALDEAPAAMTRHERRQLLRYANRALVKQLEGFFSRPWAKAITRRRTLEFQCECGAVDCEEMVEYPVADFPASDDGSTPWVLAPGH
ncbi:MAG TPA: hypothetical protein VI076_01830 [Actinopolymorphaceae bacterium]